MILVCDNNKEVNDPVCEILRLEGFPVHSTSSEAEAVAWIQLFGMPQIVFLNTDMFDPETPEMLELLQIHPRGRNVPVVLIGDIESSSYDLPNTLALMRPFRAQTVIDLARSLYRPHGHVPSFWMSH